MEIVLAGILIIHGIAHLVGFVVPWKIAQLEEMPFKTTLFYGRVNVGDIGIRTIGIFWLIFGVGFWLCAAFVLTSFSMWRHTTLSLSVLSTLLCIAGLPDSKYGIWVNVVIIVVVLFY